VIRDVQLKVEVGCRLHKHGRKHFERALSDNAFLWSRCPSVTLIACVRGCQEHFVVRLGVGLVKNHQQAVCTCSMHTIRATSHMRVCNAPCTVDRPAAVSPLHIRSVRQLSAANVQQVRGPSRHRLSAGRQPFVTRATSSTDSRQAVLSRVGHTSDLHLICIESVFADCGCRCEVASDCMHACCISCQSLPCGLTALVLSADYRSCKDGAHATAVGSGRSHA
jgi:hypothetical protein